MNYNVKLKGKYISLSEENIKVKIAEYEDSLEKEIKNFNKNLTKSINKPNIYLEHLEHRNKFLMWTNKKFKLQFSRRPNKVLKREIFYCELGNNIGSEQSDKRPVVILQNDIGNSKGNTTIIAPITTHHGIIEKIDDKYVIKFTDNEGRVVREKVLDFYEVPITIEKDYDKNITGFANIAHLREIDKKRLDGMPVAKITEETLQNINEAIKMNLEL